MSQRVNGVVLPPGYTGSSFFHHLLWETTQEYDQILGSAGLPRDAAAFRATYTDVLPRIEAARASSKQRTEIARSLVARMEAQLGYDDGSGFRPLKEALADPSAAPTLSEIPLGTGPGLSVEVPFGGRVYRGTEVAALADRLSERRQISAAAAAALRWIVNHVEQRGGRLDLRGERFVLLGAAAELAPTAVLMRAGARVLWIDVSGPERVLEAERDLSGTLVTAPGVGDLLHQPREIRAAIEHFAAAGPVHVGMFAYAAGASQEWRLCASMISIVRALPAACVASVSLLISPTTVCQVSAEDLEAAAERAMRPRRWHAALERMGALATPGHVQHEDVAIARAIVSIQGVSYQAAQYVCKLAAAESLVLQGLDPESALPAPTTVSANVGGITRTRSLAHPVFQAAFAGASAFDVQIFEPATTRALASWLMLHDLQNPKAAGAAEAGASVGPAKAHALFAQQLHGGLYSLPYALEPAIRIAAVLGMLRRPSVLWR